MGIKNSAYTNKMVTADVATGKVSETNKMVTAKSRSGRE
jgi:hypothetical protein